MTGTGRILHLYFPYLRTDWWRPRRANDGRPFAIIEKANNAVVIVAVDRRAQELGLAAGRPLAEARAQLPDLQVEHADPAADRAVLLALARAAGRYTPLVGIDPPFGLALDITGCAHLFAGEASLLSDACRRFEDWGFTVAGATASRPAVAWAVARYGAGGTVAEGEEARALGPLPVAALRVSEEVAAVLGRLGIRTVDELLRQPRKPLLRRFGPHVGRRIDQAEGREGEPITPLAPIAPFAVERRFAEPVVALDGVEAALRLMANGLAEALAVKGKGARRIGLRLFHADGAVREILVGASEPLADPGRMVRLVIPRLAAFAARIETESGIDLMRLHAGEVADAAPQQGDLEVGTHAASNLARLVDTLSERLGVAAVQRFLPADTHLPAAADLRRPARDHIGTVPWPEFAPDAPATRPLRLFSPAEPVDAMAGVPDGPPVRFVWRKVAYHVAAAEGPERIAPPWWEDAHAQTADYFRVEDVAGRRFWMVRRGLYDDAAPPRWFVGGLFA